jgi:hypothetical protein
MIRFSEVVDAASELSVDEQETLIEVLKHRIADSNRARIVSEVSQSRAEFLSGRGKTVSAAELMDEASREA